jgi:hypothetical protein
MKIINIGLPRTGTYSLTLALRTLGYKTIHYPIEMNSIKEYDAATEVRFGYDELNEFYPESLFIYSTRDLNLWIRSCKRHKKYYTLGWNPFWKQEENWEEIKKNKDKEIELVNVNSNKLLIIDICNGDGWSKLCDFLKKPIPSIEFPNVNKSTKNMLLF